MPQTYDLGPIYQGDTFYWVGTVTDADGNPVSLVGATLTAELRRGTGTPVVGTFVAEADPLLGHVTLSMSPTATRALPVGDALSYDVEAVWLDGTVRTLIAGRVSVVGDITGSPLVAPARRRKRITL
jgi:hypothetical protein